MNGPEKLPWWKKALIPIPIGLCVIIGGIGAWIIPPDNGCHPTPAGETRNFNSCSDQGTQTIKQAQDTILKLVADVENLGTLICAERVHEDELKQQQQAMELKKASFILAALRDELNKKAPVFNFASDRVEGGFVSLGLTIIHQWSASDTEVVIDGHTFRSKNVAKIVALLKNIDTAQRSLPSSPLPSSPSSPPYSTNFAKLDKLKKLEKGGKEFWDIVLIFCF